MNHVAAVIGPDGAAWVESDGEEALESALDDVTGRVRAALGDASTKQGMRICQLAFELTDLREELRSRQLEHKMRTLQKVRLALSRFRGINSVADMISRAPAELCRNCDFDRSMLFRVEGSKLMAESVYMAEDAELGARILSFARETPPELHDMLVETEMLRRRAPALVDDARNDPRTFKPLIEFAGVNEYVAAPIMPEGRVIGFLHAERIGGPSLDTVDRDALWTFAEGFGFAIGESVLLWRLEQVRKLMESTGETVDQFAKSEIELVAFDRAAAAMAQTTSAMLAGPDSRINSVLTRREIQVIELMAQGATNAAIADHLVISESTVKDHVRNILRKLGAANRAEAVARYLNLVGTPR